MSDPYSMDLRVRAVAAYERGGRSYVEVAEEFGINPRTLMVWVKRKEGLGTLEPTPKAGGNRSPLHGKLLEKLIAQVKKRPDATAQEHFEMLTAATRVTTSRSAVVRALKRAGLTHKKSP
jgi:transposase